MITLIKVGVMIDDVPVDVVSIRPKIVEFLKVVFLLFGWVMIIHIRITIMVEINGLEESGRLRKRRLKPILIAFHLILYVSAIYLVFRVYYLARVNHLLLIF